MEKGKSSHRPPHPQLPSRSLILLLVYFCKEGSRMAPYGDGVLSVSSLTPGTPHPPQNASWRVSPNEEAVGVAARRVFSSGCKAETSPPFLTLSPGLPPHLGLSLRREPCAVAWVTVPALCGLSQFTRSPALGSRKAFRTALLPKPNPPASPQRKPAETARWALQAIAFGGDGGRGGGRKSLCSAHTLWGERESRTIWFEGGGYV